MKKRLEQLETIDPGDGQAPAPGRRLACLTIAFHPDTSRIGDRLPLGEALPIALSRTGPSFRDWRGETTGPLACLNLSRRPLKLASANAGGISIATTAGGSRVELDGQSADGCRVISEDELEAGVVLCLAQRVVLLLHLADDVEPCPDELGMIGRSDEMERLRRLLLQASAHSAPVLLLGESGTGKELAARAIHDAGPRRERPFVCVNLAAVPSSMAASELFGHTSGAFTGADRDQRGYFEQADGGSLFLDEVGSAEPQLQSILLRVLETGEIQRLGSRESRRVDVRVIAATDADLEKAVAEGAFRAPLFHRLAGFVVRVPALRERREDIGRLLTHFLCAELEALGAEHRMREPERGRSPWLPAGLVAALLRRPWPGNVRELRNLARRMAAGFHQLEAIDPEEILGRQQPPAARTDAGGRVRPASISDDELAEAMQAHGWRIGATAAWLGISRNTLYSLIRQGARVRLANDIPADEIRRCLEACAGDLPSAAQSLQVSLRALKLRVQKLGIRGDPE
ncbi:MAG: sigma-54-dependent Fis family transcriptional regulator [Deltaproteobacteria bacterium]|nr:sigma-54-dependent Fis family transcriptional regulator [Deltaproteobacteria bacterium]